VKNWTEVRAAANLDEEAVAERRAELDDQVRAHALAEVRKRRAHLTQHEVARAMGVAQPRVSQIEGGEIGRLELATLHAYVHALGGRVCIIAEFGDEKLVIG
jgi:predicted XRE-type DNA-binding protein